MKTTILILLVAIAVAVTAQTVSQPKPIDWRSQLLWDDPNPSGMAANWTVYASNNTVVRTAQTRLRSIECKTLLNGTPAGTYALFTVATSASGDVSPPGTNLFVRWPGGNGKIQGGKNLRIGP